MWLDDFAIGKTKIVSKISVLVGFDKMNFTKLRLRAFYLCHLLYFIFDIVRIFTKLSVKRKGNIANRHCVRQT